MPRWNWSRKAARAAWGGSSICCCRTYFVLPSREGFSAYRTGWFVHFVFSAVLAAGIAAAAVAMGFTLLTGLAAAVLGVVFLWGAGVFVGVISHYNPLISLGVVAVGGGLFFSAPRRRTSCSACRSRPPFTSSSCRR